MAAVNAGQTATACAGIPDYLGLVKAQTGMKRTPEQANQLTTDATDLAERLRGRRARLHRADGKHASSLCARGLTAAVATSLYDGITREDIPAVRRRVHELIERAGLDRARRHHG